MGSNLDVRRLTDVERLAAVVRALRPFDPVEAIPAALGQLGGGPFNFRTFPRAPPVPAWCWCDTHDQVVVCLDGILTPADGLYVCASTLQPLSFNGTWAANAGVLNDARSVFANLGNLFPAGRRNWVLAGHSYGGCLTIVLAALLSDAGVAASVQVATFGSPRPGDGSLQHRLLPFTVRRYMNDDDPVVRFPPTVREAPLMTVAAGFPVAFQWSRYVQPYGGVVINRFGGVTYHELPPHTLPLTDAKLAAWAFSDRGMLATGHSMKLYHQRINLAVAAEAGEQQELQAGSAGEAPHPLTETAFNAAVASAAVNSSSPAGETTVAQGYIPVSYRAKAELIGGQYVVTWMSGIVLIGHSRSNARSLANKLNLFLRVMQGAASADHTAFNNALANYWTVCSGTGLGFNPVLVVT